MRDHGAILAHDEVRAAGFDLAAPACVMLACVLHFVDAPAAQGIVGTFARALAPGSYVVISVGYGCGQEGRDFASTYNAQSGPRIYPHSREEIAAMFAGLELIPPGIAETSAWDPRTAGPGPVRAVQHDPGRGGPQGVSDAPRPPAAGALTGAAGLAPHAGRPEAREGCPAGRPRPRSW